MGSLNIPKVNDLEAMVDFLRQAVREIVSSALQANKIDEYTEHSYDEENQLYTFDISYNQGDPRTLKIKLDVNPDPE